MCLMFHVHLDVHFHIFVIETGWFNGLPEEERLCLLRDLGETGD